MKAKSIKLNAVIDTISSKKDRSIGLRISTPELSTEERSMFMELQGINIDLTITPLDIKDTETVIVDKDLNQKSQSQRIRAVLYILFQQNPEGMTFEDYYQNKTEKYIESLKARIEDK